MFLLQHRKPHFMWLTVRTWSSLTCNTNHLNKVIYLPLWTLNLNIVVQSYLNILLKYNGVHKMYFVKGDFNCEINVLMTRNTHTNLCVGYLRLHLIVCVSRYISANFQFFFLLIKKWCETIRKFNTVIRQPHRLH